MNDQSAALMGEGIAADKVETQPKITPESLKALNPIIINERSFKNADATLYRVYTAPGEFNMVEADSAHEAFAKSGLDKVFKIERETFYRYVSLEADQIEDKEGGGVAMDTHLPTSEEMKTLLVAALSDLEEIPDRASLFEGLSLGELGKDDAPKVDTSEPAAQIKETAPAAEPTPAAEPEPQAETPVEAAPAAAEPEPELSSDDVDALLNPED